MAEYTKDTRFSWGWVMGGAVLIWVLQLLSIMVWGALGFGLIAAAVCGLGSYFVGGFVIGWKSEGRTILEAGIATLFVIFMELGRMHAALAVLAPLLLALHFAIPFAAAVFGAWIGEMVQGDIIRTADD